MLYLHRATKNRYILPYKRVCRRVENIKDFKGLYNLKNIEGFKSYSSFNGS